MKSHGSFRLALVYSLFIHLGLLLIFSPFIAAWLQPITPPQLEVMEIEPQDLPSSEETETASESLETNPPPNNVADEASPQTVKTPLDPTPQPPAPPKKDSNKKTAKFLKLGQFAESAHRTAPKVIESFDPELSDELRKKFSKLNINLILGITENGTVNLVELMPPTGDKALDQAIVTAIKRWTFQPSINVDTGQYTSWTNEVSLDLDFNHPLNPAQ